MPEPVQSPRVPKRNDPARPPGSPGRGGWSPTPSGEPSHRRRRRYTTETVEEETAFSSRWRCVSSRSSAENSRSRAPRTPTPTPSRIATWCGPPTIDRPSPQPYELQDPVLVGCPRAWRLPPCQTPCLRTNPVPLAVPATVTDGDADSSSMNWNLRDMERRQKCLIRFCASGRPCPQTPYRRRRVLRQSPNEAAYAQLQEHSIRGRRPAPAISSRAYASHPHAGNMLRIIHNVTARVKLHHDKFGSTTTHGILHRAL